MDHAKFYTVPPAFKDKVGVYFEITDDDYHGEALPLLSSHGLIDCLRSYNHFLAAKETHEDSPSLAFGRLAHMMALEPKRFAETVCCAPDVDRRTKDGKDKWAAFQASLKPGQILCSASDHAHLMGMRRKLDEGMKESAELADLLSPAHQTEKAAIFELAEIEIKGVKTKIYAKFKPDRIGRTWILDYKTTQDAWQWKFARDARALYYDLQMFFYQLGDLRVQEAAIARGDVIDGVPVGAGGPKPKQLFTLAQEKEPPYEFQLYRIDQGFEVQAYEITDRAFKKFIQGIQTGRGGYPREALPLDLTRGY